MTRLMQPMLASGQPPLVLCAPQIRLGFKRFFESAFSELSVLSYSEIPSRIEVQNAGTVELPSAAAA
jgi:flagellar biosynthesis component FlhA